MSIKKAGFLHPAKQQQQKEKTFYDVLIIVDFFFIVKYNGEKQHKRILYMYKIYIGDFVKKGTPATWTLVYRSEHKPIKEAKEIGRKLKYGMDLYIVHDNKLIARYYGGEKCAQQTNRKNNSKTFKTLKTKLKSLVEKLFNSSQN